MSSQDHGKGAPWIKDFFKGVEAQYEKKPQDFLSFGYDNLDFSLSGLRQGTLTVIGGRPSMGKTNMCLNMINEMVRRKADRNILFLSTETNEKDIQTRYVALKSQIPVHRLFMGGLREADWPKIASGAGTIASQSAVIEGTGRLTLDDIQERCEANPELEVLFIDSLNMIEPPKRDNREQEAAAVVKGIKRIALQNKLPVIVTANLSRSLENRMDKRPMLCDLRDSGSIEDHADNILFLYREEYYNFEACKDWTVMEVGVAKGSALGQEDTNYFHFNRDVCILMELKANSENAKAS